MNRNLAIVFFLILWLSISTTSFAQSVDGPLDDAGLKTMLENMGYDFKEKTSTSGSTYFEIAEKAGKINCHILVEITDKKVLWVSIGFGFIPKDKPIPREILEKLLGASYNSALMRFTFNPQTRHLKLEHSFVNDGVTPKTLRKAIVRAVEMTEQYEDLWNVKKWSAEKTPATDRANRADQKERPENASVDKQSPTKK